MSHKRQMQKLEEHGIEGKVKIKDWLSGKKVKDKHF